MSYHHLREIHAAMHNDFLELIDGDAAMRQRRGKNQYWIKKYLKIKKEKKIKEKRKKKHGNPRGF